MAFKRTLQGLAAMLQVELRAGKFIINIIIHHLLLLGRYHLLLWQLADCVGVAFGLNL